MLKLIDKKEGCIKLEHAFTPPWSRIQSLSEMTAELELDFDEFIKGLGEGCSGD